MNNVKYVDTFTIRTQWLSKEGAANFKEHQIYM